MIKRLIKKFAFWIVRKEIKKINEYYKKVIYDLKVGITDDDKKILFSARYEIETDRGKEIRFKHGRKKLIKGSPMGHKYKIYTLPITTWFVKPRKRKIL